MTAPLRRPAAPLLLTGFDPFGGSTLNPSWLVARALHGQRIAGHAVVAEQLPTVFGAAQAQLHALLQAHRPALVLCLGQAGGRAALSIERIAINVADARIPDNQGAQPVDRERQVTEAEVNQVFELDGEPALDLLAEDLRLGQNALNAITGEFTSDDLLGVLFSSFCIGK